MMKLTLAEIAKRAQVSIASVSRFYKDRNSVSPETRQKIEQAVKELGIPLRVGRKKGSITIALLVPDIENPFFANLVKNIELFISRSGCFLLLCNTSGGPSLEEKYLDLLEGHHVDGIIFVPSGRWDESFVEKINRVLLPVVVLDRAVEGLRVPLVLCDNEEGGRMATEYLLRLGRKKIAFISGKRGVSTSWERLIGYQRALEENGIGLRKELIFEGDFTFQSGVEVAKHIVDNRVEVDAIFAANDFMALGAMDVLKKKGVKIPEDISIVGYDDIWLGRICEPSLTTVRQPIFEMCESAVGVLLRSIRSGKVDSPQRLVLKPELVVRESCLRLSGKGGD
jgi:DNA-binding LacI/PurR family transcriptional regulator